jgi:RNA polymerase sigma factor (TIGR02999 family)
MSQQVFGSSDQTPVSVLIRFWREGNPDAGWRLAELMYEDFRHMARGYMRRERPDHTLQPTALVNEMFVRVFAGTALHVTDRRHLLAIAARQLRRILINYARDSRTSKRGSGSIKVSLEELGDLPGREPPDLVQLDIALATLQELDPRAEQVVTLRYFAGLTEAETAEALGVSISSVKRDWDFARTWLLRELGRN